MSAFALLSMAAAVLVAGVSLAIIVTELRRAVVLLIGLPDIRWQLRIPGAPRRHRRTECWHIDTRSQRRAIHALLLLSTPTRSARQDRALHRSNEWL